MLLKPVEVRILALIGVESPQRNEMKRGLGTESRLPIGKYPQCFASKKSNYYLPGEYILKQISINN